MSLFSATEDSAYTSFASKTTLFISCVFRHSGSAMRIIWTSRQGNDVSVPLSGEITTLVSVSIARVYVWPYPEAMESAVKLSNLISTQKPDCHHAHKPWSHMQGHGQPSCVMGSSFQVSNVGTSWPKSIRLLPDTHNYSYLPPHWLAVLDCMCIPFIVCASVTILMPCRESHLSHSYLEMKTVKKVSWLDLSVSTVKTLSWLDSSTVHSH